ncbi:MAG: hypothetical protein WCJ31_14510 [Planctomycetia bacterium]
MSTRLVVRRIVVTVSLVGGIFMAVENLWALRPPPALELSPSTTWITEPLAADGLPDYFQAVMDLEPRGIPPEINAAAAVWEVIPSETSSENAIDHSQAHLSAADQRPESERLVMPPPPPDGMDAAEAGRILGDCSRTPWHTADHPWLARWLEENQAALDTLAAGARREGWCPPRCLPPDTPPTERFGPIPLLICQMLPVEGALDRFSSALLARSMLRLGEGDIPGAWHDLDSLLRYGDKICDTPGPLICRRVATSLILRTCLALQPLILEGHPDDTLLAEMQRSLRSAVDWAPLASSVDTFDRLAVLDAVTVLLANPSGTLSPAPWQKALYAILKADQNVVLRAANQLFDAMVVAAGQPTRETRRQAWQAIKDEIHDRMNATLQGRAWFQPYYEPMSEALSKRTVSPLIPNVEIISDAGDRARAALVLVDCAAAHERYRLATGQPPATLADLVPTFLPAIPVDPLTDAPLGYRIENGRWTLWSGTDPEEDDVDELVIRDRS